MLPLHKTATARRYPAKSSPPSSRNLSTTTTHSSSDSTKERESSHTQNPITTPTPYPPLTPSLHPSAKETTDSNIRYAAYATRIRTILLSAHRYVAYTSDIGESFRPIAHPYLVKGAYGISWAYLIGDVTHEGYKAYRRNQRIRHPGAEPGVLSETTVGEGASATRVKSPATSSLGSETDSASGHAEPGHVPAIEDFRAVMVQRAVFQSVASMGLPAFTIHSIVRYSGRALKNARNQTIRTYGPIGVRTATPFFPGV